MMKLAGKSTTGWGALAAAVFALGVVGAGGASAAPQQDGGPITVMGACGDTFDPGVTGAKAYWEVQCTSTSVRISGWVEDTRADGKCAKVKATYGDGSTWYSAAACPKGERQSFNSPYRRTGKVVDAYLYTYDV